MSKGWWLPAASEAALFTQAAYFVELPERPEGLGGATRMLAWVGAVSLTTGILCVWERHMKSDSSYDQSNCKNHEPG